MRVELLATPDCPHAARTEATLRAILEEEGGEQHVSRMLLRDLDAAASAGFVGSPTVRVNGRDVMPAVGLRSGLACRLYRQPDGSFSGAVPPEAIRQAVQRAREREEADRAAPGPLDTMRDVPAQVMRTGFLWASRQEGLERFATSTGVTRGLVERFVAGNDLEGALAALERLRDAGLRTTVDVLGESVDSEKRATVAADRYVELLGELHARRLDGNVSLKLTQMGLEVDPAFCLRNVRRVIEKAAESGSFVRVDMEDHSKTDVTLRIARQLHGEYPETGVVIQSYLRRSADDVAALIRDGIRVRLCKGAYDEPPTVAFASKAEVDESYRVIMERLLLEGTYPAIATHDERLIGHAREFVEREGIPPDRYEFQMLYGVRRDLQQALVEEGAAVRVYVPFGHEWYPYFMRRLAERPANVLFLLRNLLRERRGSVTPT